MSNLTEEGLKDVASQSSRPYYAGRTIRLIDPWDDEVKGEYRTIAAAVKAAAEGDMLRAGFGDGDWRRVGQIFEDGIHTECR